VSSNGKRRPPRPQIQLVSAVASESEAAAIVAGVEQVLADTAPAPSSESAPVSRWQRAALLDGVSARNLGADIWGQNG
jgi:hypothetical protein